MFLIKLPEKCGKGGLHEDRSVMPQEARSRNSNKTLEPNTVIAFLCESH